MLLLLYPPGPSKQQQIGPQYGQQFGRGDLSRIRIKGNEIGHPRKNIKAIGVVGVR